MRWPARDLSLTDFGIVTGRGERPDLLVGVPAAGVRFPLFLLLEDGGPQLEREKQLGQSGMMLCPS